MQTTLLLTRLISKKVLILSILIILLLTFHQVSFAQSGQALSIGKNEDLIAAIEGKMKGSNKRMGNQWIDLKISNKRNLKGKINYHKIIPNGHYVIGEIENIQNSSFYLKLSKDSLSGNIILINSRQAFKYFADNLGNAYVEEVAIDKVICIDMPEAPLESDKKNSARLQVLATNNLESLPGATGGVVLLDFDGQYVSGTPWNTGNPINAQPSGMPDWQIQEIWEIISEDYRPFNLNITTDTNVYNSYPATKRQRCIFTPTRDAYTAPAGGVAHFYSFYSGIDDPCWVFQGGGFYSAQAGSHEIGHTLGLFHDGRSNPSSGFYEEYYAGNGNWAPIMGVGYYKSVSQFSKGEYSLANNQQDHLDIIRNVVGYRVDDHGNIFSVSTPLILDDSGSLLTSANSGVIETRTDLDMFSFNTIGGHIALNFDPALRYAGGDIANLNILVTLYNQSGSVISIYNPSGLSCVIDTTLAAGKYYISIDGVGEGDPLIDGYTDYGSLGIYTISGKIPVNGIDVQVPIAPSLNLSAKTYNSVSLSWAGATDNVAVAGYYLYKDGVILNSLLITGSSYTVTGLAENTNYNFYVVAADAAGNKSIGSNVVSVSTDAAPDTRPPSAPFLTSTGKTFNSVSLSWSKAEDNIGVTGYNLYEGTSKINSSLITGTFYTATGLNSISTYNFTVVAYDAAGNRSLASNVVTVTTDVAPDTLAPSAPVLTSTGKTFNTVSLSWSGATDNVGVTGYNLYEGTSKLNSSLITGVSYIVTGLNAISTYNYTVVAYDAAGNNSLASNIVSVTTDAAPDTQSPTAPVLISTGKTVSSVSLSWSGATDNIGIAGYNLYEGSNKINSSFISGTSYTVTGLNEFSTYNFTVVAYDAAGNSSLASNVVSVTTDAGTDTQAPTPPVLISTAKTTNTINLFWSGATDNIGVTGYDLYMGGIKVNFAPTIYSAYTIFSLDPGTEYSFTVKSRDAAGNVSMASNVLTVRTDEVLVTAINNSLETSLTISPNPNNGIFNLKIENEYNGNYSYSISNAIGIMMMNNSLYKKSSLFETEINISDLSPGIYYVVLNYEKVRVTKKIVKY